MKINGFPSKTQTALSVVYDIENERRMLEDASGVRRPNGAFEEFSWRIDNEAVEARYLKVSDKKLAKDLIKLNRDCYEQKAKYLTIAIEEHQTEKSKESASRPNSFFLTCSAVILLGTSFHLIWSSAGASIGSALGLTIGSMYQRFLENSKKDRIIILENFIADYKKELEELRYFIKNSFNNNCLL